MIKNFFAPCQDYLDEEKNISKIDAYLVLFIMIGLGYSYWRSGWLFSKVGNYLSQTQMMISASIFSAMTISLILIFCKLRSQKIGSLGFNIKHAKQSLVVGTLLSIVYIILFVIISKGKLRNDIEINLAFAFRIVYEVFFVALFEEIVIRAYTGIRLRTLLKNKSLTVFITGFIWALLHIPAYAASAHLGVLEYITKGLWPFSTYILLHIVLNTLYAKYNNVVGGTILHATINILPWLFSI